MPNVTTNYGLKKPLPEEFYDVEIQNSNMDIIDAELAKKAELAPDGKIPSSMLPDISNVSSTVVILTTSDWVLGTDGRYSQTVSVPDVAADTEFVVVDVDLSTDDADARLTYLEAWMLPSANEVDQGDGTLTFYALGLPTVNIPVNVGVM